MAAKKTKSETTTRTRTSGAKTEDKKKPTRSHSMPKAGKDPEGGLTAAGRAFFAKTEGARLRPGVQGPADTPEKMVRKGSFLRRHFTHPRGPMKDEHGGPTRLALSAHAWGEPVPNTAKDARQLAQKGHELLEAYHEAKGDAPAPKSAIKAASAKRSTVKAATRKPTAKKAAGRKSTAKKHVAGRAGRSAVKKAGDKPQKRTSR